MSQRAPFSPFIPALPASPLPDDLVFNSSAPISAKNELDLRAMLQVVDRNISDLDMLVNQLGKALRAATLSRTQHLEFSQRYREAVSPVRQVPDDILTHVFKIFVVSQNGALGEGSFINVGPSMILSHVNRRWRNVALHTPSIWAVISICVGDSFKGSLFILLQTWITRSGASPLSIDLSISAVHHTPQHRTLLDMLIQQSHRWKEVLLELPHGLYQSSSFPITRPTAQLVSVHLNVPASSQSSVFHTDGLFSATPSLRHVNIRNFSFSSNTFQWSTIKYLRIEQSWHMAQTTLLEALQLSVSLETFILVAPLFHHSPTTDISVTVHNLRTLQIHGNWAILDSLTTPLLEILHLQRGSSGSSHSIISFLGRTPVLGTVHVGSGVNISFLNDVVEPSPIRQLLIEVHRRGQEQPLLRLFTSRFLDELSQGKKGFPMLEELAFTVSDGDTRPEHLEFLADLRDIVMRLVWEIRRGNAGGSRFGRLKKIKVCVEGVEGSVGFEMFAALKELGIEGLEIVLERD
ncbi:hypothetical protein DL96DRAFT_508532 [Flagelloscypha sp. PMI_526]|nr:hypothetical protein DL96DRAFT_508532 [Flagelloscypha sp. PMI_526]